MAPNLSDAEWKLLADLFEGRYGLRFDGGRRQILEARLISRLEALRLRTFSEYYHYLLFHPQRGREEDELRRKLTNNETYFLREAYQFDLLVKQIAPLIQPTLKGRPLRILSAACSSGEEVYSMSIVLKRSGLAGTGLAWRIDACDLDPDCLTRAKEGRYLARSFRGCPEDFKKTYFVEEDGSFLVRDEYREHISFVSANLLKLQLDGVRGPYDIIFCRNALIYFSEASFHTVISNFSKLLSPTGYLFLGHAESLIQRRTDFSPQSYEESVIYQKTEMRP